MNRYRNGAGGPQRLVMAGLVVVTALLAVRTGQTARDIAAVRAPVETGVERTGAGAQQEALVAEMNLRRDRLAAVAAGGRDPFAPVAAQPRREPAPVRRPAPTPVTPSLRALVYDDYQPAVQIDVGPLSSGWLGRGETFAGWTVTEVRRGSARVSNGNRTFDLRLK